MPIITILCTTCWGTGAVKDIQTPTLMPYKTCLRCDGTGKIEVKR